MEACWKSQRNQSKDLINQRCFEKVHTFIYKIRSRRVNTHHLVDYSIPNLLKIFFVDEFHQSYSSSIRLSYPMMSSKRRVTSIQYSTAALMFSQFSFFIEIALLLQLFQLMRSKYNEKHKMKWSGLHPNRFSRYCRHRQQSMQSHKLPCSRFYSTLSILFRLAFPECHDFLNLVKIQTLDYNIYKLLSALILMHFRCATHT